MGRKVNLEAKEGYPSVTETANISFSKGPGFLFERKKNCGWPWKCVLDRRKDYPRIEILGRGISSQGEISLNFSEAGSPPTPQWDF